MPELTFHYRNRPWVMIAGIIIGAILCAVMLEIGFGIFGFKDAALASQSPGLAVFFTVAAIFAAVLTGLAVFGLARSFHTPRKIVLDTDSISAPKAPVKLSINHVPYTVITRIQVEEVVFRGVLRDVILTVVYQGGLLRIPKSCLADPAAFDQIRDALEDRTHIGI